MIVGLGIDICDIKRIENTLAKYGDKFKRRCFTEKEISKCNKIKNFSHVKEISLIETIDSQKFTLFVISFNKEFIKIKNSKLECLHLHEK